MVASSVASGLVFACMVVSLSVLSPRPHQPRTKSLPALNTCKPDPCQRGVNQQKIEGSKGSRNALVHAINVGRRDPAIQPHFPRPSASGEYLIEVNVRLSLRRRMWIEFEITEVAVP